MKRVLIAAATAAAVVAAFPAWAGAATLRGTVVAKSAARGTIAVASARGTVRTLHVRSLVRPGARITARVARRGDGTYNASRVVVRGRVHRARIHGVVAGRAAGRLLLSAGKSMIVVHTRRARSLASTTDGTPDVGTEVEAEVEIAENGELDEEHETDVGDQSVVEVEGTVASVGAGQIQVRTEGGMIVTVNVPAGIDLQVAVGDEIELKASVQGTTLTLIEAETEHEGDDGGDG